MGVAASSLLKLPSYPQYCREVSTVALQILTRGPGPLRGMFNIQCSGHFRPPVSQLLPMSDPVGTILQRLSSEYGAIEDVEQILRRACPGDETVVIELRHSSQRLPIPIRKLALQRVRRVTVENTLLA